MGHIRIFFADAGSNSLGNSNTGVNALIHAPDPFRYERTQTDWASHLKTLDVDSKHPMLADLQPRPFSFSVVGVQEIVYHLAMLVGETVRKTSSSEVRY